MPWYERAKAGDKVVCVDDFVEAGRVYGDEIFPVKHNIYTIRDFIIIRGETCVRLEEIHNKPKRYLESFGELVFRCSRFRPVKSTESGMQVLRSILNGNPITEKQDDRKRVDA